MCIAENGIVTFRWQERGGARESKWKSEETTPTLLKTLNGRGERGVGGHVFTPLTFRQAELRPHHPAGEAETWCRATGIRALLL